MREEDLQRVLATVAPAAVAAFVVIRRVTRFKRTDRKKRPTQDEGEEINLQFPTAPKRGQADSFTPQQPLKLSLLDVHLPIPLNKLWDETFGESANLIIDLHGDMKDRDIKMGSWRAKPSDAPTRTLTFTTPLTNPFGPKLAMNTEVFTASQLKPSGFAVDAQCISAGVPFGGAFANFVRWEAVPTTSTSCHLTITGECRFIGRVFGPIKGTIERESVKGMSKAYDIFGRILSDRFGGTVEGREKSDGGWLYGRTWLLLALLGSFSAVSALYVFLVVYGSYLNHHRLTVLGLR